MDGGGGGGELKSVEKLYPVILHTPTFKFLLEVFIMVFNFFLLYFQVLLLIPEGFYLVN